MVPSRKTKQKALLKASLLKPLNLFVLAAGFVSGAFSYILVPIGIMAYGILCYLDLSSKEFAKKVLKSFEDSAETKGKLPKTFEQPIPQRLKTKELQHLKGRIMATKAKIAQLYEQTDSFTQRMLGDFSQIEDLVTRSDNFLYKAQSIRDYLSSENIQQIQQDVTSLQTKIQRVRDDFSKRQYQQALDARYTHLQTLQDIQQVYERLISQLTNISISLDSMYSKMMKLKTSEYSLANAESEQVAGQLNELLDEMEQLDSAINDTLSLPE